jgi:DNA topoisomerase VI subunit A
VAPAQVVTRGPNGRFSFALFIEKEGFFPLFEAVHLEKRYDLALTSTKGLSVTALRHLVEKLSRKGVTLLVLHDFDKSAFSILGTLRRNTRRYRFHNRPNVIDIGLRLDDLDEGLLTRAEDIFDRKKDCARPANARRRLSPVCP